MSPVSSRDSTSEHFTDLTVISDSIQTQRMMDDLRTLRRPDQMAATIAEWASGFPPTSRHPLHSAVGRGWHLQFSPVLSGDIEEQKCRGPFEIILFSGGFVHVFSTDSASPISPLRSAVTLFKRPGESPLSGENKGVIEWLESRLVCINRQAASWR